MEPEEIQKKYGNDLQASITDDLQVVLSRLLKIIVGISVIIPDGFKSHKGSEAVKCSCKA